MSAKKAPSLRRAGILTVVPLLALCTAAAGAYVGLAPELAPSRESSVEVHVPANLEEAFWRCDYIATQYGVQAAPVAFCSQVTAVLQQQKFAGDFDQLLDWWRHNKPAEHGKLRSLQFAGAL